MKALVIRSTGSFATVFTEDGRTLECKVRGLFRLKELRTTNPVAVGDRVLILEDVSPGSPPMIIEIEDRDNYLIRKSINLSKEAHVLAANIDQAYVVVTLHSPRTSFGFIDRVLITCEAYHISATILVNKADLYEEDDKSLDMLGHLHEVYTNAGYEILVVSALNKMNLDVLREHMQGKTCLFTGHSGSGKSSLVNAIDPQFHLKTGEISDVHKKGKHTTTFAELHALDAETWIVDTPGVKEFGIIDIEKSEIGSYFPEFRKVSDGCKFSNCMHVDEPGCMVRKSAEDGIISAERYDSYLGLLQSEELKKPKR